MTRAETIETMCTYIGGDGGSGGGGSGCGGSGVGGTGVGGSGSGGGGGGSGGGVVPDPVMKCFACLPSYLSPLSV